jgi:hypothetical protein
LTKSAVTGLAFATASAGVANPIVIVPFIISLLVLLVHRPMLSWLDWSLQIMEDAAIVTLLIVGMLEATAGVVEAAIVIRQVILLLLFIVSIVIFVGRNAHCEQ